MSQEQLYLSPEHDLLGALADLPEAQQRPYAERSQVARLAQASYVALLAPSDPGGLSLIERALLALRVAVRNRATALAEVYRARLRSLGAPTAQIDAVAQFPDAASLAPRERALLEHVDLLTTNPRAATPAAIEALTRHGFDATAIVVATQLIAFVNFQVRILAGLQGFGGHS